ncbi:cysteine proteinase inhibitor-like [Mangifera indica]|uniref:cysteine proteinase inhibitor-like n=1 Tax=Mangifera indica TaxID=29780 RepID=UPI001CF92F60|nr:cysteine proteinase inhibitor-like [Mangifera indica]
MATLGGVRDIDVTANAIEIDSLARFAVDEYNKKQNSTLQFVKVVKAKQQVVSGTVYYLTLEAKEGDQKKLYEAKVWEKPWLHFKELQEFKLLDAASA